MDNIELTVADSWHLASSKLVPSSAVLMLAYAKLTCWALSVSFIKDHVWTLQHPSAVSEVEIARQQA